LTRRGRLLFVLEAAPSSPCSPGAACPGAPASARPSRRGGRTPILRHVSGSERGGWPLFCRLLLWATRNARAAG